MLDHIEMKSVSSSNVDAVGYDPFTHTMQVQFKGGAAYLYHNVSQDDYDGALGASSIGSYIHRVIKAKYGAERL